MIGGRKKAENGEDFPDKENRTNLQRQAWSWRTHTGVSEPVSV